MHARTCPGMVLLILLSLHVNMSEALAQDMTCIEALSKAFEDVELQAEPAMACMQDFGHRFYHEAPNDVFELPCVFLSNMEGKGGLNVLRLVSKRCMRVAESVATRLKHNGNADSFPMNLSSRCKNIKHIICNGSLRWLEGCPHGLKSLLIRDGRTLLTLCPLSVCKDFKSLQVEYVTDIACLSSCTRLKKLVLTMSTVTDLTPISSMPMLEELNLWRSGSNYPSIEDLSPLSQCRGLKSLDVGGNKGIKDLSPLCQCPDLEKLYINDLLLIKDLSFLNKVRNKGFTKLRFLDIAGLPLGDLSPLIQLNNLEEIVCLRIPPTTSLLPLARCRKLKRMECSRNTMDLEELKERRPVKQEGLGLIFVLDS